MSEKTSQTPRRAATVAAFLRAERPGTHAIPPCVRVLRVYRMDFLLDGSSSYRYNLRFAQVAAHQPLAEVAELADAQASGACGSNLVGVRVPPSAPITYSYS